jgi:hypothetical protein
MKIQVGRRTAVPMAALLAVTTLLSACGGSSTPPKTASSSNASTSTPSPTASSVTSSSPTPQAHATEVNPPGDIPDNQVFVSYRPPGAPFTIKVPEGWARSSAGGSVTFTDKLNSITVASAAAGSKPTVASVRSSELPTVQQQGRNYKAGKITAIHRKAGPVVLATYLQDSSPDPVTNKVVRDAVERYSFWTNGTEAVLTLSGPKGADNVDPWRIVSDSLTWH